MKYKEIFWNIESETLVECFERNECVNAEIVTISPYRSKKGNDLKRVNTSFVIIVKI